MIDPTVREIGFLLTASITLGILFIRTYLNLLEVYGEERQHRADQARLPKRFFLRWRG